MISKVTPVSKNHEPAFKTKHTYKPLQLKSVVRVKKRFPDSNVLKRLPLRYRKFAFSQGPTHKNKAISPFLVVLDLVWALSDADKPLRRQNTKIVNG